MKSAATYNSIHVKDMELNVTSSYHTATTVLQSISIITAHSCSQTPCAFPAMPCLAVRPSQHDVCFTSTAGQFLAKKIYKCTLVGVAYTTCKPWYLMKTCLAHYNHSCCDCVYLNTKVPASSNPFVHTAAEQRRHWWRWTCPHFEGEKASCLNDLLLVVCNIL